MSQIVALDKLRHRNYRVRSAGLSHSAAQHTCAALLGEFSDLAAEFPIIFVRAESGDALRCVALLGIKPGQNLFWQEQRWQARYIPAALRAHPFAAATIDRAEGQFALCLDEQSPAIVESGREGEALFDAEGRESIYLTRVVQSMAQLRGQEQASNRFVSHLRDLDLLEEQVILVKLAGGVDHRLSGVFRVNEKALNALSDEAFVDLRRRGYLAAIYAHLNSLRQVNNLSRLHGRVRRESVH